MQMESSITGNLPKNGQTIADRAAGKVQDGIRDAQQTAKDAGNALSNKVVDDLRSEAGPTLTKVVGRAQAMGRQGMDAVSDAAQRARNFSANASDLVIDYTKENPVKALLIAAATGAAILGLIKVLKASRD
jgi:ElaB/YqjD/DUF883 family membrane-anchored ribosome-binding protein